MAFTFLSLAELQAQDPTRFESEIRAYEISDQQEPPPTQRVVFVGSSSIRMWSNISSSFPGYPIINRGFGGSTMADLLYYFDRLVAVYDPSLVVVYEGDNDLADGNSVEEIASDYLSFIDRMNTQLPTSDFAFMSVKPSPARSGFIPDMKVLNQRLQTIAEANGGYFFDVFTPMLDADDQPLPQLFISDMLHLNKAGYRLWRQTLTPMLGEWASDRATGEGFSKFDITDGFLHLEWDNEAILETSDKPVGPWTVVTVQTPGKHIEPATAINKYFRLR